MRAKMPEVQKTDIAPQSRRTHFAVIPKIWERILADNCFDLAAQISFYFSLALFPFFLVLAVLVGWLPSTSIWKPFATWTVTYLPAESRSLVFSIIVSLSNGSTGILSFGLLSAIWSASLGFVSLMESLSVTYGSRDSRSYWHKHAIAIGLTLLAAIFAVAFFGLIAFGHWSLGKVAWSENVWHVPRIVWEILRWIFTLFLICFGIDLMNFLLPACKRTWRWLSPGTVFAVIALVASSLGLNLYVQLFPSFPRIYGTLGGFIVLMLWIYNASLILLIGAEADHEIEKLRG